MRPATYALLRQAIDWYGRRKLRRLLADINQQLLHASSSSPLQDDVARIFEEK